MINLEFNNRFAKFGQCYEICDFLENEHPKIKKIYLFRYNPAGSLGITICNIPEDAEYLEAVRRYRSAPTFVKIAKKFKKLIRLRLDYVLLEHVHSSIDLFAGSSLIDLSFNGNKIEDLGPLCKLTQLKYLVVSNNRIKCLKPLKFLKNMIQLKCDHNRIKNLEGLESLCNLTLIDFRANLICSREPFIPLCQLDKLKIVYGRSSFILAVPNWFTICTTLIWRYDYVL